jgi:hypothetical protein
VADSDPSDGNSGIFKTGFAVIIAFVIAILALGMYLAIFKDWWPLGKAGFSDAEWNAFEPRLKVAVKLAAPSVLIGAVLIAVGLWMAIVEWRGRFAVAKRLEAGKPGERIMTADEAGKVIEALSKLQGAALVMVIGALLMLSAAWVAQSAASPPPASPTSATAAEGT